MNWSLFAIQLLNSFQLGALLFLLSAGLTLVFGIMNFLNLAHGSLYMVGAYAGATALAMGVPFPLAALAALGTAMVIGTALEVTLFRRLYARSHLDQVLCCVGLMLIANEVVRAIWGTSPLFLDIPASLAWTFSVFGQNYPAYRVVIILSGVLVAVGMYMLINKTRIGMLIRAGALNAEMVSAMGINIKLLNSLVFAVGAGLAGLAGLLIGPLTSVQPGMGEPILILTLVVIIIGGIGSVRGAFLGAVIVGLVDTVGRIYLQAGLLQLFDRQVAQTVGPALASMLIYLLMAVVLAVKPQGLFPVKHG